MINKDLGIFQYKGGDLVYIISSLTSQLGTASCKVAIKYVGSVVVYKIIDPHKYLIMMLDGEVLRGIFKHERLKPTVIRTNQGNVQSLTELRQIMNTNLKTKYKYINSVSDHSISMNYFMWNDRKSADKVNLSHFYDLHLDRLINSFMHR